MIRRVLKREYPKHIIERIIAQQMRLTEEDGELYVNAVRLLRNAFDIAESFTDRCIVKSEVEVGLSCIDKITDIHIAPVYHINSINYLDLDGTCHELEPSNYNLVASEHRSRIEFFELPQLTNDTRLEKVVINVLAGYSDCEDIFQSNAEPGQYEMPGAIESAVQLMAGTLALVEGDIIIGRLVSQIPTSSRVLLQPYRLLPYGSQL